MLLFASPATARAEEIYRYFIDAKMDPAAAGFCAISTTRSGKGETEMSFLRFNRHPGVDAIGTACVTVKSAYL